MPKFSFFHSHLAPNWPNLNSERNKVDARAAGTQQAWGQLTSEPGAGNAFLNVLKKEDLREKRDSSMREAGDGGSSILAGGRRVTAGFTKAPKGKKSAFAAGVYVTLIKGQSFGLRALQLFNPQNTAKKGYCNSHAGLQWEPGQSLIGQKDEFLRFASNSAKGRAWPSLPRQGPSPSGAGRYPGRFIDSPSSCINKKSSFLHLPQGVFRLPAPSFHRSRHSCRVSIIIYTRAVFIGN